MKWEIERHDWSELGKSGALLPGWIIELVGAEDRVRAQRLAYAIEAAVVPVNGQMMVGASQVVSCLVQGLLSANTISKVEIVHLLFQFAGGVVNDSNSSLLRDVKREVELGIPIYCEIAESGTSEERLQCIDLLSLCARFGERGRGREISILQQIAKVGAVEAAAVAVELEDLTRDGYYS